MFYVCHLRPGSSDRNSGSLIVIVSMIILSRPEFRASVFRPPKSRTQISDPLQLKGLAFVEEHLSVLDFHEKQIIHQRGP